MNALLQFLVAISILAITGLGTWLWRVHSKTHQNEVKLSDLRTEFAEKFVSQKVTDKIFDKLAELGKELAALRTDVEVLIERTRNRGKDERDN